MLLRYHTLWFYCCEAPGHPSLFAPVIGAAGQPSAVLNGAREETLAAAVPGYGVTLSLPARLRVRPVSPVSPVQGPAPDAAADLSVRRADASDVEGITAFYAAAPADVRRGRASVARSIAGGRRTFVGQERGEITACALTTVELPALAMIGGLHARDHAMEALFAVIAELVRSLAAKGKGACVVTRDPPIDAICDRLDFTDVAEWQIVHLTRHGTN